MTIVSGNDRPRGHREDVRRSEREVLAHRLTAQGPYTVSPGVPGVLETYGKLTMVCGLNIAARRQPAHDDSAVTAAAALQIPPCPPRGGKPQFELDCRRDVAFYQAELGSIRRRRFNGGGLHARRRLSHTREVMLRKFAAIQYRRDRAAFRDRHHLH